MLSDAMGRTGYAATSATRSQAERGQRQRIAIARVMLKDAPILLSMKPPAARQ